MADELDKFVLEYKVDLKNSLSLLQRLDQAMGKTKESSEASKKGLSEFASGAADEIGKLIPGIDKVTTAVRAMGAEFALAATAVLAVGAAVKSVMDVSQQYEAQRKAGQAAGVGTIRMEEYRRKFQRYGNGRVTNEVAADTVQKVADLGMRAYQDPTRMSAAEAKQLRLLGIQIGKGRNGITSTNQLMSALGERFASMKPSEVQGVAANLGINRDAALALARMGKSAGSITELSKQDIESRMQAQDNVTAMNVELAKLKEGFKETEQIIAEKLLPAFTKLVGVIATIVGMMPNATRNTADVVSGRGLDVKSHPYFAALVGALPFGQNLLQGDKKADQVKVAEKTAGAAKNLADAAKRQEAAANKTDSREELVKQYDETFNEQSRDTEGQFGLAVNMFAGAVASFSNAIDERQAWAAWAGEIGRAAGLSRSGPMATRGNPSDEARVDKVRTDYNRAAERQYEDIFARATREFHLPEGLLKAQARVESGMNPKAVSGAGAQGLMQILPDTQRRLGVTDPFDPEQSIFGAAKLMRENLDRYGDVNPAIMAYHGGTDEANWGPKTRAYLAKVNIGMRGDSTPMATSAGGESRDKMMLRMVQQNIANRLGVPLGQLQQGGVNRGDVQFASSQLEGGIQNNIIQLQKQLDYIGLPQQVRSKIMTDIQEQQRGLSMLRNYAPQVAENSQPGARSITIGERAVIINIDGAADPQKMGETVQGHLMDHINDIANGMADGMKY